MSEDSTDFDPHLIPSDLPNYFKVSFKNQDIRAGERCFALMRGRILFNIFPVCTVKDVVQ